MFGSLGEFRDAKALQYCDIAVTPEALDRLCLERIARFKRPTEYRFVESLPKKN